MSEPFVSFAQSFRIFFSSVLTLSFSGIVGFVNMAKDSCTAAEKIIICLGFFAFVITILLFAFLAFYSMNHEVKEGMGGTKLQREINVTKFQFSKWPTLFFVLGVLLFTTIFVLRLHIF